MKNYNNIKNHIFFLFILYFYYLFPLIFTGSLLTGTGDNLNSNIVYNHIAGKIILGNFEAIDIFLGGELPWQFLKGVFYPITLFYSFLESEKAFWITDIILRTLSYFSFFYLLRKINKNSSYNYLLSLLFSSSILLTSIGVGLITFPFLVGLLLKKKKLKFKNYIAILAIGLNSDLYIHGIYILPVLFFMFFILNFYNKKNFYNLIKIIIIYSIAIIASNSSLFYSIIYLRPFHSEEIIHEIPNLIENFKFFFKNIYGEINPNIFINFFFIAIIIIIFIFSFLNKNKKNIYVLLLILLTSLLSFILNIELINTLRMKFGFLKATNFDRFNQFYYCLYTICLYFLLNDNKFKFKKYLKVLIVLSIFFNITSVNGKTIVANTFNYYELTKDEKFIIQNNFANNQFIVLFKNLKKFEKNNLPFNKKKLINSYTSSSFKTYYQFQKYEFIKNIVRDERILSIGIDPLKAVMNGINVVDGYYYLYPLSYKKKFEKIYKPSLKSSIEYKNFNNWGHRLQISTSDLNLIDLLEVKKLGANYILTNKDLHSKLLILVCKKCNKAENFNLYKIN